MYHLMQMLRIVYGYHGYIFMSQETRLTKQKRGVPCMYGTTPFVFDAIAIEPL